MSAPPSIPRAHTRTLYSTSTSTSGPSATSEARRSQCRPAASALCLLLPPRVPSRLVPRPETRQPHPEVRSRARSLRPCRSTAGLNWIGLDQRATPGPSSIYSTTNTLWSDVAHWETFGYMEGTCVPAAAPYIGWTQNERGHMEGLRAGVGAVEQPPAAARTMGSQFEVEAEP